MIRDLDRAGDYANTSRNESSRIEDIRVGISDSYVFERPLSEALSQGLLSMHFQNGKFSAEHGRVDQCLKLS